MDSYKKRIKFNHASYMLAKNKYNFSQEWFQTRPKNYTLYLLNEKIYNLSLI